MTLADKRTIIAAADYLEALVNAHAQGRWTATPRYRKGTTVLAEVHLQRPPLPGSNIPDTQVIAPHRALEARYRIATQPETARAMVRLLRAAAEFAPFELDDTRHVIVSPALAAARSILEGSW